VQIDILKIKSAIKNFLKIEQRFSQLTIAAQKHFDNTTVHLE